MKVNPRNLSIISRTVAAPRLVFNNYCCTQEGWGGAKAQWGQHSNPRCLPNQQRSSNGVAVQPSETQGSGLAVEFPGVPFPLSNVSWTIEG
jgi:hypothetical protein